MRIKMDFSDTSRGGDLALNEHTTNWINNNKTKQNDLWQWYDTSGEDSSYEEQPKLSNIDWF